MKHYVQINFYIFIKFDHIYSVYIHIHVLLRTKVHVIIYKSV